MFVNRYRKRLTKICVYCITKFSKKSMQNLFMICTKHLCYAYAPTATSWPLTLSHTIQKSTLSAQPRSAIVAIAAMILLVCHTIYFTLVIRSISLLHYSLAFATTHFATHNDIEACICHSNSSAQILQPQLLDLLCRRLR